MAKQSVSIVERHVEKGLLGICVCVLLAAIVLYLVSTPNTVELGGVQVTADTVDQHIRDAADRLHNKLRNAPVPDDPVTDYLPEFNRATGPLTFAGVGPTLPAPVPPLPRVPDVGGVALVGEIRLAAVIAPEPPSVSFGRATLDLPPATTIDPKVGAVNDTPPPGLTPFSADVNWVTVGALFDQRRQMKVFEDAGYNLNRRNPYVVGVDLQRQRKLPGGSWEDWRDVEAFMPRTLSALPEIEFRPESKKAVTETTRQEVLDFFKLLKFAQADLHRPMFPHMIYPAEENLGWLYPKFTDIDVAELDRELCTTRAGEVCTPRRYPKQYDIAPAQPQQLPPRERIRKLLDEAKADIASLRCQEADRTLDEVIEDPDVRTNELREANALKRDVEQCRLDIIRKPKSSGKEGTEDKPEEVRRSQYQVIWAHDIARPADGGMASGETYRYRVRVRLYNRFCAVPESLADGADASKVFVAGEWSEPTEELYAQPDNRLFFTGGNPFGRRNAKATVFKWVSGVWVDERFPLEVGRPIGETARACIGVVGGTKDKPKIDFDTGAVVVDINYDYPYRPIRRHRKGGFEFRAPKQTIAMVYMDAEGRLHQRILEEDKSGDEYKRYKEMVVDCSGASGR